MVSFDARKGRERHWSPSLNALLHASKLLLISADSVLSCRLWLRVSWPRSLPARSTSDRDPRCLPSLSRIDILHCM